MTTLFLVGFIEMVVVTAWTQYVTKARVAASGVVTVINIFIWYYVLNTILNDMNNTSLIAAYALGCALGTMMMTYMLGRKGKRQMSRLLARMRVNRHEVTEAVIK